MKITKQNFDEVMASKDKLIVLDFWASWCGPCKMLAPVIETAQGNYPDVIFGKINVDEESELAVRYSISSIPTLIFIKNGKPIKKSVGYCQAEELYSMIDSLL